MDAPTFLFDLFKVLCYTDLHLGLMRFYRFLAPFSQFSRKFPGSCEERAVLSGNSGRFRDYSGRVGKDCEVLENRLRATSRGFESPTLRQYTKKAKVVLTLVFCCIVISFLLFLKREFQYKFVK